jgi:pimeloyl-ACP methyl ester carboxylesterase
MNVPRNLKDTNLLSLPDGRSLSYAEYGDREGLPIILFHGNHNSRLMYGAMPGSPFRRNLHLIVPDRPGFGLSDFYMPGTSLVDYPDDIAALADSLDISEFAVFGYSGGGPSALACAWKMPRRILSVGLFGSIGPLTSESSVGILPLLRILYRLSAKNELAVRIPTGLVAFMVRHFLGLYLRLVYSQLPPIDKAVHLRLGLRDALRSDRVEGFRQGGRASAYDIMLAGRWPIPLNEIQPPVYLWQGEKDLNVGDMGKLLAEKLPNCYPTFIPGAGHYWFFDHFGHILDRIIGGDN